MIGWGGQWTWIPSATPLQPKNEMLIFGLCSMSDDRLGWSMDSNPIHHPSPAKKMKCLFLYYGQLLMIGRACWWTWIPSATPPQPKKWSAHFLIMFNFWWLAGLVNGLEPHLPSLSKHKNDMLIFVLHSSSDHWLGWSMDSNPIHHPSPTKTMKCSFLDYVELLIVGWAGQWTRTPSTTCLQAKNEMLILKLRSTSDDWPGWSMDSNPICNPSPTKKWNAHFCIMFKFWWSARLVDRLEPHLSPLSNQKMKCLLLYYVILLMIGGVCQ